MLLQMGMGTGFKSNALRMSVVPSVGPKHRDFSPFHEKGLKFYTMTNGELYGYTFLWIIVVFICFAILGCILACCMACCLGGATQ